MADPAPASPAPLPSPTDPIRLPRRRFTAVDATGVQVLATAGLARLIVDHLTPVMTFPDSLRFQTAVSGLRRGMGFALLGDWTAPLPVLVWGLLPYGAHRLWPRIVLQHVLGLLAVAAIYAACRALHGARAAAVVALGFALSPYVLFVERSFLGEAIHLCTVAVALCAFVATAESARPLRVAPLLGIALGIVCLAKGTGVVLAIGLIGAIVVPGGGPGRPTARVRIARAALTAAFCLATVVPWLARQHATWGKAAVVPNVARTRLLFALEAGLFDARSDLPPSEALAAASPGAFVGGRRVLPPMRIVGDLIDRTGPGAPSESHASAIVNAEIARKPLAYVRAVADSLVFLVLDVGSGHDEVAALLDARWGHGRVPEDWVLPRMREEPGSEVAMRALARLNDFTFPLLRLLPLLALAGTVAGFARGGSDRTWAMRFAIPVVLLPAALAAGLANNFRFLIPFLPLFALAATGLFPLRRDAE